MKLKDLHVAIGTVGHYRALIDLAVEVERLGFGGVWIPESSSRDAFVVLADIATRTRSLELGTGIVNHFSRTPSALAQAAITLSEAGGGRIVNLGLGASTRMVIQDFHGLPFQRTAQRMRETIDIVRKAAAGELLELEGDVFRVRGFSLRWEGERGPVRLFVAGLAPGMLIVTGERADGWLPIWPSRRAMDVLREPVAAAAEAAGRPMPVVAAYIYTHVGPDVEASRRALRRSLAWYMAAGGRTYNNLYRRYGFGDTVDAVEEAWRKGDRDRARSLIPDAVIEDMCVVGDPATAPAQFASFQELGVDVPIVRFPDGVDSTQALAMVREIAAACEGAPTSKP